MQDHCRSTRLYSRVGKRLFDLCFSLVILLCFSPLFILIALTIKLTSKGPIFYQSYRYGKNGKIFSCLKFRTMYVNADQILLAILLLDPRTAREWNSYHKLKKDPRVTPIGRFLRKTSLDEFPQFINVLFGTLSVVGPRPYLATPINQLEELGKDAQKILSVTPGITGIWQTSGRNKISFKKRIVLEEKYIEKQSFIFDLLLIVKTIPAVLSLNAY